MRKANFNNHEIVFYDSPEDLPLNRYQRFNKFLMIDNEVGSDFEDYVQRTRRAIEFLNFGQYKEAAQEISNRAQMVFNAFEEYVPRNRALAILVYSIDGKVCSDYTKTGLDEIIEKLDEIGFTKKQAQQTVQEVKKKIERELKLFFPSFFQGSDFYNSLLITKAKLELEEILTGKENEKGINDAYAELLKLEAPNSWNIHVRGNKEEEMEAGFQKFLLKVKEHVNEDVSNITVYKFYVLLSYINEKK